MRCLYGLLASLCYHTVAFQLNLLVRRSSEKASFRSHTDDDCVTNQYDDDDDDINSLHGQSIECNRRSMIAFLSTLTVFSVNNPAFAEERRPPESITVPLKFNGKELLIDYRVDGSLFRAVLDTGSPFLMVPGACGENTRSKSGCYRNQGVPSGLESTYEIFDGFEGDVEWRMAPFSFANATGSIIGPTLITFGVVSESIMSGPGAVFFGLVKSTEPDIRPSFLGQTPIESFEIDLLSKTKSLTFSTVPLINGDDYIKLTSILRRRYGDPVTHYTAQAKRVEVNGFPLAAGDGRPIYVIIDTGVTGMVVSRDLFNERYTAARQRRERNLWGNVTVAFKTVGGKTVDISATKPITTPFDPEDWKKFRGHLIVMGLSFLDNNKITIDMDDSKLLIRR